MYFIVLVHALLYVHGRWLDGRVKGLAAALLLLLVVFLAGGERRGKFERALKREAE
jgi:hypothetical protein